MNQSGARQFILSSTENDALNRMVTSFGLNDRFDAARGLSDGLARGKISAGLELLDEFQIDARSAVLIGDTVHDAEVAGILGVDCVLISSGHQSPERLSMLNHPVLPSLELLFR
jgi:phosphoglycolate phosphatase